MPVIKITIPTNAAAKRVVDAICLKHNYPTEVPSPNGEGWVTNPQSRQDFALARIKEHILSHVIEIESEQAEKTAKQTKQEEIKNTPAFVNTSVTIE
jgi:hypothetical protein